MKDMAEEIGLIRKKKGYSSGQWGGGGGWQRIMEVNIIKVPSIYV